MRCNEIGFVWVRLWLNLARTTKYDCGSETLIERSPDVNAPRVRVPKASCGSAPSVARAVRVYYRRSWSGMRNHINGHSAGQRQV